MKTLSLTPMVKTFSFTPLVLAAALALTLPVAAQTGGAAGGTGSTGTGTTNSTGTGSADSPGTGNTGNTGSSGTGSGSRSGNTSGTSSNAPTAGSASTQGSSQTGARTGAMAAADRTFMLKAAGSGLYEVEASRLAAERATNSEVKDFAQKMVADHDKANQELMALASARGVTVPAQMPGDKRKEIDKLSKAKNFDTEYMRNTGVKEHQSAVALFEKASKSAKDPELKSWAAEKLPTLREHLAHAQRIKPGNTK